MQRFYPTSRTGYHPDCKECQGAKTRKKRRDEQFRVTLLEAVARSARLASREIQAQKVMWPGEVDDLADALKRLDAWERDSAPTQAGSDRSP